MQQSLTIIQQSFNCRSTIV